jgi:N-acetylglucosamine kinase-like BadF-type ATPase
VTGARVGVDGGGSHTVAVTDRGTRGEAGPSNPSALGFEVAADAIAAAIRQATPEPPERVAMGVAGAGRPADGARLAAEVARRLAIDPAHVRVVQDVAILLPAAGLASGIALVAGTGSSAYGVRADGQSLTTGGWGYLLGDEGSAFYAGRAALMAVAAADDGTGPPTALTDALLAELDVSLPRDVITAVYQAPLPRNRIASLAPAVVATAQAGDRTAGDILAEGARALGRCAVAIARRLSLEDPTVVAVGGMFQAGPPTMAPLAAELSASGLRAPILLESEPAEGALRLAMEMP